MIAYPIIGLMSGTSVDGIDASLVYTNGKNITRTNFNSITPYSQKTQNLLNQAMVNPLSFLRNIKSFNYLSTLITIEHAKVVNKIIKISNIKPFLVGFHGQTIFHNPVKKKSFQLGNGAMLSDLLKISVVNNFRSNDLKFGGQGAPIAPIYHKQIIESLGIELPTVIANIGGISNITYWDGDNIIGFETGTGNKLMDYYMQKKYKKPYDKNGKYASKGKINFDLINHYSKNLFFLTPPPKSLERIELFNNQYLKKIFQLNEYDCLATLCALTSFTLKMSFNFLPFNPKNTIIVGGGQRNKHLVNLIKASSISKSILTGQELNLPSDFIESELIAILTARKFYNLPSTFPSTTGVTQNTILGDFFTYS